MLRIECRDYFEGVRRAAVQMGRGALTSLHRQLHYLGQYACRNGGIRRTRCLLFQDFAPYSFGFVMQIQKADGSGLYDHWFNGGLIYSGPGVTGEDGARSDGGAPSFTCSLDPGAVNGRMHQWSVHT